MNRKHRIIHRSRKRPYTSAGRPAICIATALVAFFSLTATAANHGRLTAGQQKSAVDRKRNSR